jgi:hypothetical protein
MQARVRLVVLALFALVMPSLAGAQDATALQPAPQPAPQTAPAAGPTIDGTATAFRAVANLSDMDAAEMQRRQSAGKPVALMIVGGAAILVGAVIGDAPGTLFMVGGAVALLYGLYLYLQ